MTDTPRRMPADLREEAGDDDVLFRRLMSEYGYMMPVRHPDRARRRELGIGRGFRLPPE